MVEYTLKITPEQAKEMPMVDVAFEILKAANTPFYYRDLMKEIAKVKGLSDEEAREVIAQVYTEINIDGRFACVGQNLWGLKRWYPVDRGDEAVAGGKHPRIINEEDDDDDLYAEEEMLEEEEVYDGEEADGYGVLDEDADVFADDDDVVDPLVDDDVVPEEPPELDEELEEELEEETDDFEDDYAVDEEEGDDR